MTEIPEDIKKLGKNRDKKLKVAKPAEWIDIDDKGHKHINEIKLAQCLEKKYKFTLNQFSEHGYWFDPTINQWKGHADAVIEGSIKDEIVPQGIWRTSLVASVAKLVTLDSQTIVDEDPFNNPAPYKAVFGGHTYNLQTDKLEPSSPDNHILQNRRYELNMSGKAETWNKWLKQSLVPNSVPQYEDEDHTRLIDEHDVAAIETVKAFIGFSLIGSYKDFQIYMILYGSGGEGKSTFLNKFMKIIGKPNVSNVSLEALSDQQEAKFATSKLYHKSANVFADISPKFMNQTNIVKTLTGGDTTTAQFKYQDPFEFENEAKLIFSANDLPAFNDFTDGFKRRPIIVTFHKIKHFKEQFKDEDFEREMPAFVHECLLAYKNALETGTFPVTKYMKQQKQDWINANDNIGNWISDCCTTNPGDKEKAVYLYNNYKNYCQNTAVPCLGNKRFVKEMTKRGYIHGAIKINGKTYKGYKGIALQNKN